MTNYEAAFELPVGCYGLKFNDSTENYYGLRPGDVLIIDPIIPRNGLVAVVYPGNEKREAELREIVTLDDEEQLFIPITREPHAYMYKQEKPIVLGQVYSMVRSMKPKYLQDKGEE